MFGPVRVSVISGALRSQKPQAGWMMQGAGVRSPVQVAWACLFLLTLCHSYTLGMGWDNREAGRGGSSIFFHWFIVIHIHIHTHKYRYIHVPTFVSRNISFICSEENNWAREWECQCQSGPTGWGTPLFQMPRADLLRRTEQEALPHLGRMELNLRARDPGVSPCSQQAEKERGQAPCGGCLGCGLVVGGVWQK